MPDHVKIKARVTGRVQGVSFRAWTEGEARALGLSGWVRNEGDGSVTVVLAGREENVAQMLRTLRLGPPSARVRQVETEPAGEDPAPGFHVKD